MWSDKMNWWSDEKGQGRKGVGCILYKRLLSDIRICWFQECDTYSDPNALQCMRKRYESIVSMLCEYSARHMDGLTGRQADRQPSRRAVHLFTFAISLVALRISSVCRLPAKKY